RAAMPSARSDAGSAVLNGILYVIGGEGDQGVLSSVEAYDPLMDTWAEKAPLPVALGYSPGMAATFNGRIYVAGGYNAADNELSNAVYVYDPTSDSWSAVSSMPTARQSDGVAAVGGKLYVLGGYAGNPDITADVDAFTPDCSPIPTPSPTPTATATFTPTPTATATFTPTPTATAAFTSTPTPTFTPTPTATATATATFTPTPTATATPTPTSTPTPTPTPAHVYAAQVQPPINADGSSVFTVKRDVVPVKFTLTDNGSPTCDLPPATIVVTRTAGGTP